MNKFGLIAAQTAKYSLLTLAGLLAVAGLNGCSTNPVTGEPTLNFMPESWDRQVGAQQYAPMLQSEGGVFTVDDALNDYVSQVGQRIARHADLQLDYEFKVLNNGVPNAWALPGGKIAVNRGLLTQLESEAELAAVLGHEIVHAAARHGAQAQSRGTLLSGAVIATNVAMQGSRYGQIASIGAGLGAQLINTRYSREAELEADEYGMRYMAQAGYDPQGAVDLQATFVRLSQARNSDWLSGLFASHPPSQQRLTNNRRIAASLPPGGETGRERYQRQIARLKQAEPAYEAYQQGLAAANRGQLARAEQLARRALAIEPGEARFHALLGDIEAGRGNLTAADQHFTQAIVRDDQWFYFPLRRGMVRQRLNRNSQARQDLRRSVNLLPTGIGYYELGVLEKQSGNTQLAVQYLQTARQAGGQVAQLAAQELQQM